MFKSYDFKFTPLSAGGAKAFAVAVIDGVFEVDGFKIMETNGRLWVAFPQEKGSKPDAEGNAVYYKRCRFIDAKDSETDRFTPAEKEFTDAMIEAYTQSQNTGASRGQAAKAHTQTATKLDPESARAAMQKKRPMY